jgi:hypothetical protein
VKNTKEMTIVNRGGSRNKLTQNINRIGYIGLSDSKIDKAPNKMAIARQIRKRVTIRSTKLDIELHRSLNSTLITKSSTSKEILDILLLGDIKAIQSGGNLNPKKVAKRTKISHKELLVKTGLNKVNILRIIAGDDHIINIEEDKGPSSRRSVNKQRGIMSARGETGSSHHGDEALKLGARGLFQAIERAPKMTNHAIRNRVPWRRLHVDFLTQLAVTQHTTACCSMQVVDITLAEQTSTNITSLRMVQHKHCEPKYKLIINLLQTKA